MRFDPQGQFLYEQKEYSYARVNALAIIPLARKLGMFLHLRKSTLIASKRKLKQTDNADLPDIGS